MGDIRKTVLLFSTGLDSICLYYMLNADINLFILTGTKDNENEFMNLKHTKELNHNLVCLDMRFLKEFELPNKIIPYRNHFFVTAAAQFGQDIYIGATLGDTTRDKDETFAKNLSDSLSYFANGPKEKIKYPGDIKIHMPLKNKTKAEIVKMYLHDEKAYNPNILIHHSSSCYYPKKDNKECGECRSCLRKYVALRINNLEPNFQKPSLNILENFLQESIIKQRSPKEIKEIEYIIRYY